MFCTRERALIGEQSEPLSGHVNGSSRYIFIIYVRQKSIILHALNQLLSDNKDSF